MNPRGLIIAAALLWSLSGAFNRLFDSPWLGLDEPRLSPLQRAALRALFAGLVLVPLVRPRDITFRPLMFWTAAAFTLMNATYITAMTLGTSGSAVLLQYTAPLWIFLITVFLWREPPEPRGFVSLLIGMAGVAALLYGGWSESQFGVVLLALASGLFFGLVLLGLRAQRDASPIWLTVFNHLVAALALSPFLIGDPRPTWPQLGVMVLYGGVQMGLPYALMAKASKEVGPREAATLTLLEPILNPVWAYLIDPVRERPTAWMAVGGVCVIGALAYRYWPTGENRERAKD